MRRTPALIALFLVLAVAGCGSKDRETTTPVACLAPAGSYLKALQAAPGEVRLAGETPISACFGADQGAGDIAQVGESAIKAATDLNAKALRDPSGQATVQLGFLVGAVQKGTGGASGVNADFVRRLDSAARFNPDGGSPGAAFERAFGKGYAEGQDHG